QGDLRDLRADREDHGRTLQERHGTEVGGGELPDRRGFSQRDAQRQGRLRHARTGVRAGAGARGRFRILAVGTGKRLAALPDQPTMTELGIPMDLTVWWAAMVPAATPKPI